MIYNDKLNWKYHIEHIAITFVGLFKILRQLLGTKLLETIYFSLVNPIISFGIIKSLLLLYEYNHVINKPNHNYNTRFEGKNNVKPP